MMKPRSSASHAPQMWLSGGLAAVLTALVGLVLFMFPIGDGANRFSFDLPFELRPDIAATNVALVVLDEASHIELQQPMNAPWDRSLHARLVDRLTEAGAKAIVFDILFTDPSTNAAADTEFARAIKQSGRVILGANFNQRTTTAGAEGRWEELPYEPFRAGAAAWGNVNLLIDSDYGVRRCFPNLENLSGQTNILWLPRAVAQFAGASGISAMPPPTAQPWLNYCGPPGVIPSVSYFLAMYPDGVPPGFFKDKIVFIGAQMSAGFSGSGKDEFRTPYSYWGQGFSPGVEVHATAALNLIRGNWLRRLPFAAELALILITAALAGFGLMRFQPLTATLLELAGMLLVVIAAFALVWWRFTWFAWIIPLVEIGVAALCSVAVNSVELYVEKRLHEQQRRNYEVLLAELAKAADYVRSLLPARLSGEVETEWCFQPCEQLGGDSFGYHWIDRDHLAVYLLDVCGHGVGAALLSVSALNALRAHTLPGVDFREPASVLNAMNRSFRMEEQNNLFFSAWYGVYHRLRRELVYASGGHPPALLLGDDLKGPSPVMPLQTEAPAIGCLDEAVYRSAVVAVTPGSRLLVFSDGIFEIFQGNEKAGTWNEFLASFSSPHVRRMRPEERLKAATKLRGKDLLEDDFSIVDLRFN